MDNMLYIIAGLVLILLVAGFLLRKNKAQKQSVQPPASSVKNTAAPASKTDYGTAAQTNQNDSNKFDHITIAQRFMDQQRYDKAIETINRGLNEKPNDSQLSIKLLSIYATLDQPENFHDVYNRIKMHNDAKTITLADELKDLYIGEQSPVAAPEVVTDEATTENNQDGFDSLDFDLSTTNQADDTANISDRPVIEDNNDLVIDKPIDSPVFSGEPTENVDDSFDLTLSDLEDDFNESNATDETPVTSLATDDDSLYISTSDHTDTIENNEAKNDEVIEDNDLSDFEFDFESPAENTLIENSDVSDVQDSESEALVLEDDFILDFDDLAADADKDASVNKNEEEASSNAVQNIEDDFTLSLDDIDAVNTFAINEPSTTDVSNDIDDFVLEDIDFENADNDSSTLEDDSVANLSFEEQLINDDTDIDAFEASDTTPVTSLRFDDDTPIADDFDIIETDSLLDSSVATPPASTVAPAELETDISHEAVESAEDFSSRFAADFDFVKSLDSNQVTLDLANQYLQLGEYDSAKRLLNEVIAQGNSEQKQQAQLLLERTA
ncbi:FimV/HubP family polar landmark protein [Psychrobacter pacificensis]|uniref:FimV/HubP family polar landmark protein n=1 Tax=Psychrobacter pacificensis TaxID=112002 RepID=UPI001CBD639A|nr:FimV/HubP family polar landmark protein [Psychrobacter pacificensis]MBZ1393309.1 pilus assembly protein FimV [Psychrobacter pacificensis]